MNQQIDYSRKWYAMVAVSTAIFMATYSISSVNLALPTLVRYFDTEIAIVQWVVLAFLLTSSSLLLGVGRIADIIGKKTVYVAGFIIFTFGSLFCALASTITLLIIARIIQAIGVTMFAALSQAIVTESFPRSQRGKALGITGLVVSLGSLSGPILGGFLIDALSWCWIFLFNIPIGVCGAFLAQRFLPNIKPEGGQSFDYWGSIIFFVGLISLLLGLTKAQTTGFTSYQTLSLLTVSLLSLVILFFVEKSVKHPLIDFKLFKNETLQTSFITTLVFFLAISGTFFLMPFYLENILGYPPSQVGFLSAIVPIMLGIIAPIAGILSDRFGTRLLVSLGLTFLAIGYIALSRLDAETNSIVYITSLLPMGIGIGFFISPNQSAIMGAVSQSQLGVTNGLLGLVRNLGQILGIAISGILWASFVAIYSESSLSEELKTASVTAQVAGLQDTFRVILMAIALILLFYLWRWFRKRN